MSKLNSVKNNLTERMGVVTDVPSNSLATMHNCVNGSSGDEGSPVIIDVPQNCHLRIEISHQTA